MTSGLIPSLDLLSDDRFNSDWFLVVSVFHVFKFSKVSSHSSPIARGFGSVAEFPISILLIVPPDFKKRSIEV